LNLSNSRKNEIFILAEQLRSDISLSPLDPIKLKIEEILEKLKYEFIEIALEDNVAALSEVIDKARFVIKFNSKLTNFGENFKRFTLTHELAHLLIPDHINYLLSGKNSTSFISDEMRELEADYFAACFLIPKQSFIKKFQSSDFNYKSMKEISDFYGVSLHTAISRFIELSDLSATAIFFNSQSNVNYAIRSSSFWSEFPTLNYLGGNSLNKNSNGYEFLINEDKEIPSDSIGLLSDYYDTDLDLKIKECSIWLEYNSTLVILIEPYYERQDLSELML